MSLPLNGYNFLYNHQMVSYLYTLIVPQKWTNITQSCDVCRSCDVYVGHESVLM